MEKSIIFSLNHSPIKVHFSKNHKDFIVRERPLYEFSGVGEHAIIYIQKKGLSTQEAIRILSSHSGLKQRDFSYAGLKDKEGLTFQYLSLLYKHIELLKDFHDDRLKILDIYRHDNKLRIGHLKGNSFFIRLKKVSKIDAMKLKSALAILKAQGFANYFGYQRFGKYANNASSGESLLKAQALGAKAGKNKRLNDFLISAYQSSLFNTYLSKRIELCKFYQSFSKSQFCELYPFLSYSKLQKQEQFFKLLLGDILGHYPFGKCFICEDLDTELERFLKKDISVQGLLIGLKNLRPKYEALGFEADIFKSSKDFLPLLNGGCRPLISFLKEVKSHFIEEKAHFTLEFYLEKGCYATVVLEELLHCSIKDLD